MNKIRTQFLALLAVMLLGTGTAHAVDYDLYVKGIRVTSSNASNVLGDGHVSYNASTKTLTLNNATISYTGQMSAIRNIGIDGLVINVVGTNTVSSSTYVTSSMKSMHFSGTGSLKLNCTSSSSVDGISFDSRDANTTCSINGPKITINSNGAFSGSYNASNTVSVTGSTTELEMNVTGSNGVCYLMNGFTIGSGLKVTEPAGCYYSTSLNNFTTNGTSAYKGKVVIKASQTTEESYNLWVKDTRVTSTNASNVLGDGRVSYNASTKTLTLNNATITHTGNSSAISCNIEGLSINVAGTNTINCPTYGIGYTNTLNVKGTGSLTLNCTSDAVVASFTTGSASSSCVIDGPKITSNYPTAFCGSYTGNNRVTVTGTTTELTMNNTCSNGACYLMNGFTIGSYLGVTEPAGCYYSTSMNNFTTDGFTNYVGKLVIKAPLMYIGETRVTPSNADDILGNGQFRFDYPSKTLYVNNANLTNTGSLGGCIDNREFEGLDICLIGDNTLVGRNNAISSNRSFTISGRTATLKASSTESYAFSISAPETPEVTCTVDGPQISFTGKSYALNSYRGNGKLIVNGSTTSVTLQPGNGYSAMNNMAGLTLGDGVKVQEPEGGYFSTSLKSITTNGTSAYKGKVVIGPDVDYGFLIADVVVTSANAKDVLGDGHFSFDAAKNVLTVKNANLTKTDGRLGTGIDIRTRAGLTINIEGDNYIKTRNSVIGSQRSFTITGTGTLNGVAAAAEGMTLWGTDTMTCTVSGPKINIQALGGGLIDYYNKTTLKVEGSATALTFQPCTTDLSDWTTQPIDAYTEEFTTIKGLNSLVLGDGIRIVEPEGGRFDSSLQSVTADGRNAYQGRVSFGTDYGFLIADVVVASGNASDVLGNGQFSYDAAKNVLTVKNANVTKTDGRLGTGIDIRTRANLTINIEGDNYIKTRNSVIGSQQSFTITGTGTLNGVAAAAEGMTIWGTDTMTCTINGPKINILAHGGGLIDYYNKATLKVLGSTTALTFQPCATVWSNYATPPIDAYTDDIITIKGLKSLVMGNGVNIIEPKGGRFDTSLQTITTDGRNAYQGKVTIGASVNYNIYVAETMVTSSNAADILGNGQFSYNPQTNTLTVKNATLENKEGSLGSGISNRGMDDLNIEFVGDNTFTTRQRAIYSDRSFSITGSGSLTAKSTGSDALFLATNCDSLTIDGPTLTFSAAGNALCDYRRNSMVYVKGTDTKVTLKANSYYTAIDSLATLRLDEGLYITEPEGGEFSANLYNVTVDGTTVYKGDIVISNKKPAGPVLPKNYGISVAFTDITSENAANVLGDSTVSYDPELKVLTLRNANLSNDNGPVIRNTSVDWLTVMVEGQNTLNSMMNVIETEQSISFAGDGTLNLNSVNLYGGPVEGDPTGTGMGMATGNGMYLMGEIFCNIIGPAVNITTEGGSGIDSWGTASLYIGGNTTTVSVNPAPGYAPFGSLQSLSLDTCLQFTEPAGAWYSTDLMGITTDGTSVYFGPVTIGPNQPWTPEPATLAFVMDNERYTDLTISHDVAEPFIAPMFEAYPQDRKIIWRTSITEHPAEGGEPIRVMVGTEPFYVRLMGSADGSTTSMGTGQTDVSIVAYDEYVTAIATLNISFYAGTYQEPDTTTIDLVAEEANKSVVVSFGGEDAAIDETTDLTNTAVDGVLFTLNDNEGDGYDPTDESIVLNSTMSVEEVAAVMEQMKPGSGAYAAMFSGMTFLLPAGTGSFDVDFITLGDRTLSVKIGNNAAATLTQNERGTMTLSYDCTEDTYVYIYGSEGNAPTAPLFTPQEVFTKRAPRKAVAYENAVKLYSFTVKPEVVNKAGIKGDVNNDYSVNVADIGSVIDLMSSNLFTKEGDVNNDGAINVADIGAIIDIMAANARRLKGETAE